MPGFGTLLDDFDDGVRDPAKWGSSYGDVTESGGRARVPCTAGFSGYASGPAYSLSGAQVACRVYPPSAGGASSEALAELFVISPTGGTDAGFSVNAVSGQLSCLLRGGYFDPGPTVTSYSAAAHAWLRLREDGGTLRWDASSDARTWTTLRSAAAPAWVQGADLAVVLAAHRDSGVADVAEFDDFNISRSGGLRSLQRGLAGPGPYPRTTSTVKGA